MVNKAKHDRKNANQKPTAIIHATAQSVECMREALGRKFMGIVFPATEGEVIDYINATENLLCKITGFSFGK